MKVEDFSYELPPDRIAKNPASPRESARLLVCSRSDPVRLDHCRVSDLPGLLRSGDLLVLNETKVLPHRLLGRKAGGGRVECLILERRGKRCQGLLKPSARLAPGERLEMEGGALELRILSKGPGGRHSFELCAPGGGDPGAVIAEVGRAPLPPYLKRRPGEEDPARDRRDYQTVFARNPGAVAAPTAGLHFTEALLGELRARGIGEARLTLHVGEGTFEPIRVPEVEDHTMRAESYELSAEAARKIEACKASGGRVFCVGTTTLRVLEHSFQGGRLHPGGGSTSLFLFPGRGPRYMDGLLTNFHLPRSTLLLLVASILGRDRVLSLYESALGEGYRFYSFGDAMLILP